MLEYFDEPSLGLLRARFPEIPKAARAAILFDQELESEDDPEVDAWLERLEGTAALAEDSWFATTASDRERFRRFRHALPELVNDTVRQSGAMKMGTDFAVPLARNREMLAYYRRRLEAEFPGRYVIFGHIGDAHVHVNVFSDPANPQAATALIEEFARHAVSLGGTVSAEHGVGKRKAHLLALQYAPEQLEAMRAVKRRPGSQRIFWDAAPCWGRNPLHAARPADVIPLVKLRCLMKPSTLLAGLAIATAGAAFGQTADAPLSFAYLRQAATVRERLLLLTIRAATVRERFLLLTIRAATVRERFLLLTIRAATVRERFLLLTIRAATVRERFLRTTANFAPETN